MLSYPLTKNPNYFPHSVTALAVRLLADRTNWLSVVDTVIPHCPNHPAAHARHQRAGPPEFSLGSGDLGGLATVAPALGGNHPSVAI